MLLSLWLIRYLLIWVVVVDAKTTFTKVEVEGEDDTPKVNQLPQQQEAIEQRGVPDDAELNAIGWAKALDPQTKRYYYYTFDNSQVVWENPLLGPNGGVGAGGHNAGGVGPDAIRNMEEQEQQQQKFAKASRKKKKKPTTATTMDGSSPSSSAASTSKDVPSDEALKEIGWAKAIDPASGDWYYYTMDNSKVVWENPLESGEIGAAAAASAATSTQQQMRQQAEQQPPPEQQQQQRQIPLSKKKKKKRPKKRPDGSSSTTTTPPKGGGGGVGGQGMDAYKDDALRAIGWEKALDPKTGKFYYYSTTEKDKVVWENPLGDGGGAGQGGGIGADGLERQPPPHIPTKIPNHEQDQQTTKDPEDEALAAIGWARAKDPKDGKYYYYNSDHSKVVWENPLLQGEGSAGGTQEQQQRQLEGRPPPPNIPTTVPGKKRKPTMVKKVEVGEEAASTEPLQKPSSDDEDAALAAIGWARAMDQKQKAYYYYTLDKSKVVWDNPLEEKSGNADGSKTEAAAGEGQPPPPHIPTTIPKKKKNKKKTTMQKVAVEEDSSSSTAASSAASSETLPPPKSPEEEALAAIGWARAMDPKVGKYYYYTLDKSKVVWENPLEGSGAGQQERKVEEKLPPKTTASKLTAGRSAAAARPRSEEDDALAAIGWARAMDPKEGKYYYFTFDQSKVVWENPLGESGDNADELAGKLPPHHAGNVLPDEQTSTSKPKPGRKKVPVKSTLAFEKNEEAELAALGWGRAMDPNEGRYYYFTFDHSQIVWDNPLRNPPNLGMDPHHPQQQGPPMRELRPPEAKMVNFSEEHLGTPWKFLSKAGEQHPADSALDGTNHGEELMNWLKGTEDGFFHDHLTLRRDGPTSFGMYATDSIKEGDVMLRIPQWMVFKADMKPIIGDLVVLQGDPHEPHQWERGWVTKIYEHSNTYDVAHIRGGHLSESVPQDHIGPQNLNCKTAQTLAKEMKLGDKSIYAPYVNYLNSQPHGQLPTGWSQGGQDLLLEILGHYEIGLEDDPVRHKSQTTREEPLPPQWPIGHGNNYRRDCIRKVGGKVVIDPLEEHAYMLLMQRGWDDKLVPVFDMMGHRNGGWLNTRITGSVHDERSPYIVVEASRDIYPGEQIHTTYNWCEDCEGRKLFYGTPELLRDYGFVELYPQRWVFAEQDVIFDIDQGYDPEGRPLPELFFWWSEGYRYPEQPPPAHPGLPMEPPEPVLQTFKLKSEHLPFFVEQLQRLEGLSETVLATRDFSIPDYEWETLSTFHKAYINAIRMALDNSRLLPKKSVSGDDGARNLEGEKIEMKQIDPATGEISNVANNDISTSSNGECDTNLEKNRSENMKRSNVHLNAALGQTDDSEDYAATFNSRYDVTLGHAIIGEYWGEWRPKTCDDYASFNVSFWEHNEVIESEYQTITFLSNDLMDPPDICFMLDTVWQQCTSYRPQYHEMAVHFTARFIDKVKRVLFVGGGDSMLLHDILQYPTLEKVVGLEIDQFVTRYSFKSFGVSPHFDNEKVEWWYGDAAKSMLMLPKDYYGSFDMVLVDLSETVQSLSVTEELDIMDALSLLIQPKGILLKNEYMYFQSQSHIFRHTLHIHYYNTPVVCSQSLMLGSNGVDFLRDKFKDHGVDHIYKRLDNPDVRYDIARDYQRNHTNPRPLCLSKSGKASTDGTEQLQSPGITMVVEVEQVKVGSSTSMKDLVEGALTKEGLTVVSTVSSTDQEPSSKDFLVTTTIFREGYIVARFQPDHKYCALDIHLWSSFEKHNNIKKALISAMGGSVDGPLSSSYRIVSGGMFGVSTWQDDESNRGPKLDDCDSQDDTGDKTTMTEASDTDSIKAVRTALEGFTKFVPDDNELVVTVVCGKTGTPCPAVDTLKKVKKTTVVPLYNDCGPMEDYSLTHMTACEVQKWKVLQQNVADKKKKVRVVIVDPSAEIAFGMVVQAIYRSSLNQKRFLTDSMTVIAPISPNAAKDDKTWRINFVDSFRTEIFPEEPSFKSEIQLTKKNNNKKSDNKSGSPLLDVYVASAGDRLFFDHLVQYAELLEKKNNGLAQVDHVRGGDFYYQEPFEADRVYTDADFDQVTPYKQWESQQPLGFQVLSQLKSKEDGMEGGRVLSPRGLKLALTATLSRAIGLTDVTVHKFVDVGDGAVLVAQWTKGNVVVLWDGRDHVDLNLFFLEEDFEFASELETIFLDEVPSLELALRDQQPRGIGRVVNFAKDIGGPPRWM